MTSGLATALGPGLAQIGTNVGGAAVVGGLTGWATKKLVKVVAVLVGLELALLAFLAQRGVISVRWTRLNELLTGVSHSAAQAPSLLATGVAAAGVSAGFAGGFVLGFHRG